VRVGKKDFILNVGRLEPRKNQARLIKAAGRLRMDLVCVGSFSSDPAYVELCREQARACPQIKVSFLGELGHDDVRLKDLYDSCAVFALPSEEETPGIAALEAAVRGAPVVITNRGGAVEYLGEYATYVDYRSVASIVDGIERAIARGSIPESDRATLARRFSWTRAAEVTLGVYRTVIGASVTYGAPHSL